MAEGSSRDCPSGGAAGGGGGGSGKGRLVLDDPDIIEVSAEAAAAWGSSGRQKRKRNQAVPHEIIELDGNDDVDGGMIAGEKISDHTNKQAVGIHMDWPKHAKSGVLKDFSGQSIVPTSNVYPWGVLGGYFQNAAGPSATPAVNFFPWQGQGVYHGGTVAPTVYSDQFIGALGKEDYVSNTGKPNTYYSYINSVMETGTIFNLPVNKYMNISPGLGAVLPWGHMMSAEMPPQPSQTKIINSRVDEKYKAFKRFDTVGDHSDHFYSLPSKRKVQAVKKPSKNWVKRVQHEWKVLENHLPDTIFVRAYEERMDLLRAVIVGPAGTPYHDGLFFFDVYFPCQYPSKPPLVNYRSGGLRLNPNLYESGKVCLSLLNTWAGNGCEKWNPSDSTMLQVLVSIQALVLNAKPYFNEPAYAVEANTPHGEKMSLAYNEGAFLLSCRTMMYSLHNPPKHFEDFTIGHFRNHGCKFLRGCKAYMDGAQVGCLFEDGVQDVDEGDKTCSDSFKVSMKMIIVELQKAFTNIGVDCTEFQDPGAAKATADTTLRL